MSSGRSTGTGPAADAPLAAAVAKRPRLCLATSMATAAPPLPQNEGGGETAGGGATNGGGNQGAAAAGSRDNSASAPDAASASASASASAAAATAAATDGAATLRVSWARRNRRYMNKQLLRDIFAPFGAVTKVFMVHTNKHALVTMARGDGAAAATAALHAQLLPPPLSKRIFVEPSAFRTADEELAATARLVDPATTAAVRVPGLHVVDNFVSEAEAAELLADIDSRPWHETLQRRVQHYGYVFNYATNLPDADGAPPIPPTFAPVLRRVAATGWAHPHGLDQVTVNEYLPGQGIAAHVDTETAFEDGLFSLALGSAVVFQLRHPDGRREKLVYQKPRSLIVLTGDARYIWRHSIASRKKDVCNGVLVPRRRRVSLTLRSICQPYRDESRATVGAASTSAPAAGQALLQPAASVGSLAPTPLESVFVHSVYDAIAPHFARTRVHRWPGVLAFLRRVGPGALVADLGCGNGKYFCSARVGSAAAGGGASANAVHTSSSGGDGDASTSSAGGGPAAHAGGDAGGAGTGIQVLGSDRCVRLLDIAAGGAGPSRSPRPGVQCLASDVVALPYRSGVFDYTLSVAVLHHLSLRAHRVAALREMLRVTRPAGGEGLVYVWALSESGEEATDETRRRKPLRKEVLAAVAAVSATTATTSPAAAAAAATAAAGAVAATTGALGGAAADVSGCAPGAGEHDGAGRVGQAPQRRQRKPQEAMVPWHLQRCYLPSDVQKAEDPALAASVAMGATDAARPDAVVFKRYCHRFVEGELQELLCEAAQGDAAGPAGGVDVLRAFREGENLCLHWRRR